MSKVNLQDAWKIMIQSLVPTQEGFRSAPSPNIGLLQLLNSQANRNASRVKLGDVQSVDKGDGKVYKISRRFFPRLAANDSEQQRVYCPTGGKKAKYKSDEVAIEYDHVSEVVEVDDAIVRCMFENRADYQGTFVNEVLRNYINQLGQKVSTIVANQKVGTFVGGATVQNLPLYRADGQSINPVGEYIMERDRLALELSDQFVLVGNTKLKGYQTYHALQTGNDQGVNAGLMDITQSIFYDTNLGAAWADPDCILAMAPGALQFISYATHKDQFNYDFDTQMRTTVVDPWLGLEHDVIMHYELCGPEIKLFIQFAIKWDVIGMPECWSEDPEFDGVLDTFKYKVVCADTGICDVDQNPGNQKGAGQPDADLCESAENCVSNCRAGFESSCEEYSRFTVASTATDINAIRINNALDIALNQAYDLTDAGQSAAFIADLKSKITFGNVYLVSGSFAAGTTTINIFTNSFVTSVELVSEAAADIELVLTEGQYIHIYSTSVPSSGASLTDLAWTTPLTAFNGAPGAAIPAATANYYGDYDNFFAETTQAGAYQLVITDDAACNDTFNADSDACV